MTPNELAARLAQMDWSGCSLQHQLAVAAAVTTLRTEAGLCERRVPVTCGAVQRDAFGWACGRCGSWRDDEVRPCSRVDCNVIDLSEVFRREQTAHGGETQKLDVDSPY